MGLELGLGIELVLGLRLVVAGAGEGVWTVDRASAGA